MVSSLFDRRIQVTVIKSLKMGGNINNKFIDNGHRYLKVRKEQC